ncbi:MAG TPA: carbohydrate kinase family protein [Gemmatimonadales bacterium]|nr:carbohydrate kinase family protein [Gemmatimonadales bacterium]
MIGSLVWDTIYGRDPAQPAIQEWGGIAYALSALDATLPDNWEIIPLIKVGRDLAPKANEFLRTLRRTPHAARFVEVPEPNNRVTLRYESAERRCEQMSGGVPPWTWPELGPLIRDLDALYINFISGYELNLETALILRRGFANFIYADLHSLFLAKEPDGTRVRRALPQAPAWFSCFDAVQVNEDEMAQLGADPFAVAANVMHQGCKSLCVTLGARGAAYFTGNPIRTERIPPPAIHPQALTQVNDPTGCGDVFGGAVVAALLGGASLEDAVRTGTQLGTRNLTHRGATGLRDHLIGKLSVA